MKLVQSPLFFKLKFVYPVKSDFQKHYASSKVNNLISDIMQLKENFFIV